MNVIAAKALATYLIPGCVGRGVRLGSESSSATGAAAGGVWKSGNLCRKGSSRSKILKSWTQGFGQVKILKSLTQGFGQVKILKKSLSQGFGQVQ